MVNTVWKKASAKDSQQGKDEVGGRNNTMKLIPGENGKFRNNYLRILPPRADSPTERWYATWSIHYVNSRPIPCVEFHHGKPCLICIESQRRYREGDKDGGNAIRAKFFGLMNAVRILKDGRALQLNADGMVTNEPSKVEVLSLTWPTMTDLLNQIEEDISDEDEQDVSDPETGRDIVIKRKGKDQTDTKYQVVIPSEANEFNGGDFSLLSGMHDLTKVYQFPTDEIVAGLLEGPKARALPSPVVWEDDDEDDDVIEAEYRQLKSEETPWDDDEPVVKKRPGRPAKPMVDTDNQSAAKARLQALTAARKAMEDDDEDEDED